MLLSEITKDITDKFPCCSLMQAAKLAHFERKKIRHNNTANYFFQLDEEGKLAAYSLKDNCKLSQVEVSYQEAKAIKWFVA